MMPDLELPQCDIEIRVRYAEADRMGFLHHSHYFVYFEMGRTELLRRGGIVYRDLEDAGVFFAIVKLSCRYLLPGRYDDVLILTTIQRRMTTARIDHAYALRRKSTGELLTEAETTLACIDGNGRVIAIPGFVRAAKLQQ